jgi:extracellular solute-binding protein
VIARLRLGVAVKKGAPKPDISTADAVRRTLLNAASIVAIDPEQGSACGAVLMALDKLGITEQLKPKIVWVANAGMVQDSGAARLPLIASGPAGLSERQDLSCSLTDFILTGQVSIPRPI